MPMTRMIEIRLESGGAVGIFREYRVILVTFCCHVASESITLCGPRESKLVYVTVRNSVHEVYVFYVRAYM